ncbi:hypothetical protein [Mesorhizobium sp. L-8-3]|uniref:hypothetical protein n=1 Tax=Mesorhizobium sp. L-8-3 TaxID=2744522 RepID=UPI00192758B1|nr:hypothetical protein [Mesorhizobium sp. L-8-3]BCH22079.1 hypothetical protein MesoLjLb_18640 [Mesorhizobium sp. L-8-3]
MSGKYDKSADRLDHIADEANASAKGSFKLDLIETVNADPQMKPADLAVIVAYLGKLQWPKRLAWLSASHARALTGLSERQINLSRTRLMDRKYLVSKGLQGTSRLFEIQNPRLAEMRMHVQETTDHYREAVKERQASRRALRKAVTANFAGTEIALSHSPSDCDVPANITGNTPHYPSRYGSEGRTSPSVEVEASEHPHEPFAVPDTVERLETMLSVLLDEGLSPAVVGFFRRKFLAGQLTPAMIEEQRRLAS